ncbi:N,N-dimethylformamidase beta subunit family domain-containing protein [Rossellomorea sp. NRS-1567]|uniref:N,N-dimethylformamidase beta subunit family domain-containing protein n=1 Tax=Rossellomorea sp. NRS-1567 TaxID=3233901 RepID=UPI003D27D2A0
MKKFTVFFFGIAVWLGFLVGVVEAETINERIDGRDRFEVAVNISKKHWKNGADTVILANHLAYADALSASPYAYHKDAPILLTRNDRLTSETLEELKRLNPQEIILIGGEGSINASVTTQINQSNIPMLHSVSRIPGEDRFEVSENIARELSPSSHVILANGLVFADALSIAPYASMNNIPILLTRSNSIPSSTLRVIRDREITKVTIVGGTASVSEEVERLLPVKKRIGGKDRYEVSANIAKEFFPETRQSFLATGLTFADALTGSTIAAKANGPVLLTRPTYTPDLIHAYLISRQPEKITIFGGTGSVNEDVIYKLGNWKIDKKSSSIQGYADKPSYQPGDNVNLYISSQYGYGAEIYRMGYYSGEGAKLKETLGYISPYKQSNNNRNPENLGANWVKSVNFPIPEDWESGMYLIKLVDSRLNASYIPIVVNSNVKNEIGIVIATNTYQAYNNWGGKSFYGYNSSNKEPSIKLSYHRPYQEGNGAGQFFHYEYNLVRWLEKKGYKLNYYSNVDIARGKLEMDNPKLLIIPGHDEYWTKETRDSIEQLSKSNMNLANFNANVGYWQVRFEEDASTIVSYKAKASQDPYQKILPSKVTTQFRNPPVNRPENELFGSMYRGIPDKPYPMVITNSSHWIYQGTGLKDGDKISGVIGGEIDRYDGEIPGVKLIARSPVNVYGKNSVADVVWWEKPYGTKVFSVGTFYWNWFLDPYGHTNAAAYNRKIEIMTENALNELLK